ncbi:hypothetical protein BV25DRAFT_1804913 [Artomyces pyxidatus]|uniref:Uncharacterized protein n=1 Tax=Artomyces pyxidatus TaxID=48021 RepID=A0ACB8T145_9AGAM|nr:hypothetical protein BV25DRAFT_1804913 [Artomyces pyxidatus]
MRQFIFASFFLFSVSGVNAQSSAWGQCGGIGWSGATTCVSGYTCTVSNPYYSQCLPGTASSSSTTSIVTSSATPTTTISGSTSQTATTTSTGATPTGSQIRADQDPVYHFYLQNQGGVPVLGPEGSSGYFTIGDTITLNNADGSSLYLNVNESAPNSYKPLVLSKSATTTDWALEGDTIIETSPRELNFLACATSNANIYNVYLQEGNDNPPGLTCSMVSLHLPCLC